MSIEIDHFVIYGIRIPYHGTIIDALVEIDEPEPGKFGVLIDSMSGDYIIVGIGISHLEDLGSDIAVSETPLVDIIDYEDILNKELSFWGILQKYIDEPKAIISVIHYR